MARTPRTDAALSVAARLIALRRWLLVGAAVLAPVVLGALATVALYATRAQPAAPPVVGSSDEEALEGSILVLLPRTTDQVRVPLGSTIEVVLWPGVKEKIVSEDADILSATSNPPCHIRALCGFPGASIWTFHALRAGVVDLRIVFDLMICQPDGVCSITPYIYKPIAVYSPPEPSRAQGIATSARYFGSLLIPLSTTPAIRSTASHASTNRV